MPVCFEQNAEQKHTSNKDDANSLTVRLAASHSCSFLELAGDRVNCFCVFSQLSLRKINTFELEFELLYYAFNGSRIFFKEH